MRHRKDAVVVKNIWRERRVEQSRRHREKNQEHGYWATRLETASGYKSVNKTGGE